MVPQTYPSVYNTYTNRTEMVVYELTSISGKVRWTDYIPVKMTTSTNAAKDNTTDSDGCIPISPLGSITNKQAFTDYIPIYVDNSATDAWAVSATGYIPYGISSAAIGILKRPGIEAHVYLPGIGTLSGLSAANYLDSAGTTLATVDQPVGLVLDAMGSVGVELVTNGDFSAGTTGWAARSSATLSEVSGSLRVTPTISAGNFGGVNPSSISISANKTYLVTFEMKTNINNRTVQMTVGGAAGVSVGAIGSKSFYMTTSSTSTLVIEYSNQTTISGDYFEIDNISVREVTGIHATQPTTAAKPILRQTAGKYSWAFDGNDSLALGSVPFQMADDHAVIAGLNYSSASAGPVLHIGRAGSSPQYVARMSRGAANTLRVDWRDDAAVNIAHSTTLNDSTTGIASARNVGGTKVARLNGVQFGTSSVSQGATTLDFAGIGIFNGAAVTYFAGSTGPILAIKGTLTDSEMLTLERVVANLTPNAPSF